MAESEWPGDIGAGEEFQAGGDGAEEGKAGYCGYAGWADGLYADYIDGGTGGVEGGEIDCEFGDAVYERCG